MGGRLPLSMVDTIPHSHSAAVRSNRKLTNEALVEQVVKDSRRATRKLYFSEDEIRIVLSGLRGEDSIAELCRKEGLPTA